MKDPYVKKKQNRKRLYKEYKEHGKLTIGYDFDGTVNDYHKEGFTFPKLKQLLRDLKDLDCQLICWTAYKDLDHVSYFLQKNLIPYDGINTHGIPLPWQSKKPFYSALLDDRAGLRSAYKDLKWLVKKLKKDAARKST